MGRGPRHRKSQVEIRSRYLATRPTDELKNELACEIASYEETKLSSGGPFASHYLREIEAIEAVLRERGVVVSRQEFRGTAPKKATRKPAVQIRRPSSTKHPPRTQIMYIECKTGRSDRGGARIGRVTLSKTGQTLYYRGLVLQSLRGRGAGANYHNVNTGLDYWCSRPKKNGQDRHWAGSGAVAIDADVVDEYWREIRGCEPPDNPYIA